MSYLSDQLREHGPEFGLTHLCDEAADALDENEARIAELEAQIAAVAPAVDAQPVASEGVRHFNYLCSLLPEGFHWSDPLTPDVMNHIVSGASAQSDGLRVDAERYGYLRRRAVMVDYSNDTVTKLTLFKEEGPTGEFLDDWVDSVLSQHTGENP